MDMDMQSVSLHFFMHHLISVHVKFFETDTTIRWVNAQFLHFVFLGHFVILQLDRYIDALWWWLSCNVLFMPEYVRIPQWLLEAMYRESSRIMSYAVIPTSSLSFIGVCTSAGLLLQEKISS